MSDEVRFMFRRIKIGELRLDPIRGKEVQDDALVKTLDESFASVSMLQPPVVRKVPKGKGRGYWVICGGRRFRAAKKDGSRRSIVCRVVVCDDEMAREMFLRENIERSHLSVEERMARRDELTQAIASRERADRVAPGRAFHLKNAAKAAGVCTRTIERDDRFRDQLIPEALTALHRRRIGVRQAEELCGMGEVRQAAELPELVRSKAEGKVRGAPTNSGPVEERRPVTADTAQERVVGFVSALQEMVVRDLHPLLAWPDLKDTLVDVEPTVAEKLSNVLRWPCTLVDRLPADMVAHYRVLSGVSGAASIRPSTPPLAEGGHAPVKKSPESPTQKGEDTRGRATERTRLLIPGLRRNKGPVAPSN